MEDFVKNHV
jgi:putative transposase